MFGVLAFHLTPLFTRGETSAAASAQVRRFDLADYLLARHVKERLLKCAVTADAEVFFYGGGVDMAAVFEDAARLFLVERYLRLLLEYFAVFAVGEARYVLAAHYRLFDDLFAVLFFDFDVQPALRFYANERPHFAEAVAP
ncbi:hypothetical protein SDC9_118415 [bioreactor metagenome]|uniref:Uncharacterized protein n=1 Tax=bioreactor metagenome TaxID=1076179 RepID=A0A645C105_9ZZZZ